jgi:beta-glucan synthesis-associated protein KRE6
MCIFFSGWQAQAIALTFIFYIHHANSSWVDPDTPQRHHSTKSLVDKSDLVLVFSDEFEAEGRSFADGHDPKWTSINKNDYTNDALQYYKDERVTTNNGFLNISTINEDIHFTALDKDPAKKAKTMTKNYQSGMLQGWNKFCFTGGVVEISARLPGRADIGGLWPAMW